MSMRLKKNQKDGVAPRGGAGAAEDLGRVIPSSIRQPGRGEMTDK
jgi:hypothetical protein